MSLVRWGDIYFSILQGPVVEFLWIFSHLFGCPNNWITETENIQQKHVFHYFSLASSNHHVLICSATRSWDLFKANGQWDTNFCQVHQLAATLPLEMISCTGNKKNQNRHGNLNQSFHVKVSYFDAHTFEFDWIWVLYVHELIRLKECLDWFDQNYSIFQSELSRWWFQILLIFTPSLGKCSNLNIWCVFKTNDNL